MNRRRRDARVCLVPLFVLSLVACTQVTTGSFPCPEGEDCTFDPGGTNPPPTSGNPVGQACVADADCGDFGCLTTELLTLLGTDTSLFSIPNGICTSSCMDDAECGEGAQCFNAMDFIGSPLSICLPTCQHLGQCRWEENYACFFPDRFNETFDGSDGVCLPSSVIVAVYCPMGCEP